MESQEIDVKAMRETTGMSQREFAEAVGVSAGLVAQWETGRKPVAPGFRPAIITLVHPPPELVREPVKPDWTPSKEGLSAARRHLGKRLKDRREDYHLSPEDAAIVADVPVAMYRKFEKGTAIVGYRPLRALASHYGCKMSELIPKENYPGAPRDPVLRNIHFAQRNANMRDVRFSRTGTEGGQRKSER